MSVGPTELIIVLLIVLVLFGASRLPKLARSMGQAHKEFKAGLSEDASKQERVEGPCPFCDGKVPDDAKFCPSCGRPAADIVAARRQKAAS